MSTCSVQPDTVSLRSKLEQSPGEEEWCRLFRICLNWKTKKDNSRKWGLNLHLNMKLICHRNKRLNANKIEWWCAVQRFIWTIRIDMVLEKILPQFVEVFAVLLNGWLSARQSLPVSIWKFNLMHFNSGCTLKVWCVKCGLIMNYTFAIGLTYTP